MTVERHASLTEVYARYPLFPQAVVSCFAREQRRSGSKLRSGLLPISSEAPSAARRFSSAYTAAHCSAALLRLAPPAARNSFLSAFKRRCSVAVDVCSTELHPRKANIC